LETDYFHVYYGSAAPYMVLYFKPL